MDYLFNIFSLCSLTQIIRIKILTGVLLLLSIVIMPNVAWAEPPSNLMVALGGMTLGASEMPLAEPRQRSTPYYRESDRPSSDGIGKIYMGREIAQVMGHRGAAWLERPSRVQEEKPHLLVANLAINPTDTIADIGAGTGYLTLRLASHVLDGKVLAVDVQPEMLALLTARVADAGLNNVDAILGDVDDPHLPQDSVDMAIMLDVYHELEYPYEMMCAVVEALRPGGQMIVVEYRGENPFIPIKRLHKMTKRQVRQELERTGLRWVSTNEDLPRQHLMVFEKSDGV